jgi:hypothetical protein
MATIRQANLTGQMRLDAPHLRAIESGVAGDFDILAGRIIGGQKALIVSGFNVIMTGAVGSRASSLQVVTAGSLVIHQGASESGTLLWVPSTRATETLSSTNSRATGSFTANATNFVGIDYKRSVDDSTADVVQFLDATTLLETPKTVDLARTLDYQFVISATEFSAQSTILPIAKVVTDASNLVVSVSDARNLAFRLASGGDNPNIKNAYSWPGTRVENTTGDVFSGGDKAIASQKDWMDAVMTRLWELGGGEYWYSATADRNVTLVWTGSTFTNGENFEWDGTNLHWKGLKLLFDNSTGSSNTVVDQTTDASGTTNLADGECIYVDLDRTQAASLTAKKAPLTTLGAPTVPGSRYVLAWRSGSSIYTRNWRYAVGTTFTPATASSTGVVKLSRTASTPSTPVVISDTGGSITSAAASNNTALTVTGDGSGNGIHGVSTGSGAGGLFTASASNLAALKVDTGIADLPTIDRSSAAAINIGTTNANAITIGGSGFQTAIPGGININGSKASSLLLVTNGGAGDVAEITTASANRGLYVHGSTSASLVALSQAGAGLALDITGRVTASGLVTAGGLTSASTGSANGATITGGPSGGYGIVVQRGDGATTLPVIDAHGSIFFGNASGTYGTLNTLSKKNITKAWAFVEFDTLGNATIRDSFNISSVTLAGGDLIRFTFTTPFVNQYFAVVGRARFASAPGAALVFMGDSAEDLDLDTQYEAWSTKLVSTAGSVVSMAAGASSAVYIHVIIEGAQ